MEQEITVAREEAFKRYSRDEHGLIRGIEYPFNKDGSIHWRGLIKPDFLYVNKEYFQRFDKEIPKSTDGLADNQLAIKLGGIKDISKIRGYNSVSYCVSGDKDHVVASCRINWLPNYETNFQEVYFEDYANASKENTDSFCNKFLETIACNRAFVRSVRNFLNINIVGEDEIDKSGKSLSVDASENSQDVSVLSPQGTLEKSAQSKGINDFQNFVKWLREQWKKETYKNEEAKAWTKYSDIPTKECRKLLALLSS